MTPAEQIAEQLAQCERDGEEHCKEIAALQKRLDDITKLCLRYNQPGANPGCHALANKVLTIADPATKREFA